MQDSYQILGVSQSASDEEIKLAYRKLAKRYHPDLHPSDPMAAQKMNQINNAYQDIQNRRLHPQSDWRTYYSPNNYQTNYYHQDSEPAKPRRGGFFYFFAGLAILNIFTMLFGRGFLPFFFFF